MIVITTYGTETNQTEPVASCSYWGQEQKPELGRGRRETTPAARAESTHKRELQCLLFLVSSVYCLFSHCCCFLIYQFYCNCSSERTGIEDSQTTLSRNHPEVSRYIRRFMQNKQYSCRYSWKTVFSSISSISLKSK